TDARFNDPSGVTADSAGNVYVTDRDNHTVRKLTPMGTNWFSSTIAGLVWSPGADDGTNNDVRFNYPDGIAVDSKGNVYVADWRNSTMRELTPIGTGWVSRTIAGLAGIPGGDDGIDNEARFANPSGVAVDSVGSIYVADTYNNTIRELLPVGTNWMTSTIAGLAGSQGADDGTNSDVRFNHPSGVAVDSAGIVYVADTGNSTIRKLSPLGTDWVTSTIAGLAGAFGVSDGSNGAVRFNFPSGVAVDRNRNIYVAD